MSFITFPAIIEGLSIRNTAIGTYSLSRVVPGTLTGNANTAFGYASLQFTTTGRFNTAFGSEALQSNTTGLSNTAIGDGALNNNIVGTFNTAVGRGALSSTNDTGSTAVGGVALSNATGGGNTAVGYGSGNQITTGQLHTILGPYNGNQGGLDIRTASGYVVLSDGSGNPRLYIDNTGLVTAPGGFAGVGGGITLNNRTAAYTVVASDAGKAINCTANTFTVSLTAAATLGSGFACFVWNTGTGVITIDPSGAETIDGVATLTLRQGEGTQIVCDGTNWITGSKKTMRAYAESIQASNTRPTASGFDSVAIGAGAAYGAASSSGLSSIAIGAGSSSAAQYSLAFGVDAVVLSGSYGSAIGANSSGSGARSAVGSGAMSLGGSYASGADSFAAAIANNSSSYGAKGANSIAIGITNNSTATTSSTLGGASNTASGTQAVTVGGVSNTASGTSSFAIGYLGNTQGIETKASFGNGFPVDTGSCQFGIVNVKRSTTNATPTVLNVWDSATPNVNNMVLLQNNSAFAFSGAVVARQQASGGTQSAAWRVEGLIRREGSAATTTLVASTVTVISNAPGWGLALSADTTIGALAITATGALATNIRWVATVQTSEVIYA